MRPAWSSQIFNHWPLSSLCWAKFWWVILPHSPHLVPLCTLYKCTMHTMHIRGIILESSEFRHINNDYWKFSLSNLHIVWTKFITIEKLLSSILNWIFNIMMKTSLSVFIECRAVVRILKITVRKKLEGHFSKESEINLSSKSTNATARTPNDGPDWVAWVKSRRSLTKVMKDKVVQSAWKSGKMQLKKPYTFHFSG